MGVIRLKRGHQALLPAGCGYRFKATSLGVILQQTILGDLSQQKWNRSPEIGKAMSTARHTSLLQIPATRTVTAPSSSAGSSCRATSISSPCAGRRGGIRSHQMWPGVPAPACGTWRNFFTAGSASTTSSARAISTARDMYAGSFNGVMKEAGVDYTERFDTEQILATFKAILRDWVNEGCDPSLRRSRPAAAFGVSTAITSGDRTHAHQSQGVRSARRFAVARRHAGQPRLRRRFPGRSGDHCRARLRRPAPRLQPVQVSQPVGRHVESLRDRRKASLACPTTEE